MRKTRLFLLLLALLAIVGGLVLAAQAALAESNQSTQTTDCSTCHSNQGLKIALAQGGELSLYVDATAFSNSVHGNLGCQVCHSGYAVPHQPMETSDLASYRTAAMETCRKCHPGQVIALESSVHANLDFRTITCMDCHGSHDIEPAQAANLRSTTLSVCISCHQNETLMKQYGLSSTVVTTYLKDFHGRTSVLLAKGDSATINEAVCTDCHGVHQILNPKSPDSQVVRADLTATCQKCHQEATPNFPDSWMAHYPPTVSKTPLVFAARAFYWMMIPFTVLGLIFHISIDVRHHMKRNKVAKG